MTLDLAFHGAAGCVTGFCALVSTDTSRVLIDCGMFQGPKSLKALNYEPFPFDASKIDAVLLTHAHIDHSGLLPKLMRAGFAGPIYATAGTRDLCAVMLADAGDIQETEVAHLNRRNQRRGRPPVEPIYTARDAARTMRQFEKVKLGEEVPVAPGLSAVYWEAGHILGGASIELRAQTADGVVTTLFSGDLGPGGRDYAPNPTGPSGVDNIVVESTYGDREREDLSPPERRKRLAAEINAAHELGGPLLIPAFAVERAQEILADILTLIDEGQAPASDIFLDSPLAIEATEVFQQRGYNRDAGRNPFEQVRESGRLRFLEKPAESDALDGLKGWHIILAGSGMCDAGRVRGHLKRLLWRREATVLLSGFQAAGTLGRLLSEGARHIQIQGDEIRVKARIRALDIYSAHADARGLVEWVKARGPVAGSIFLAHGEPASLEGLRRRLVEAKMERIVVPALDEAFSLTADAARREAGVAARLPAEAATAPDWHNDRVQFVLNLSDQLERAPTDQARRALLLRLSNALEAASSTYSAPKKTARPAVVEP